MSKKISGYQVTVTAFLPADANDPDSMVAAAKVIRGAVVTMSEAGFRGIEARPRYRTRADVPDSPEPKLGGDATSAQPTKQSSEGESASNDGPVADDRDGAALASVAERVAAGVAGNGDPGMPERLRRKAGG